MDLLPRFVFKSVLIIGFPFILYIFNFYEEAEKESIIGFIKKWSKIRNLKDNLLSLREIKDDD
jgi:hypothetical protein